MFHDEKHDFISIVFNGQINGLFLFIIGLYQIIIRVLVAHGP